MKLQFEARIKAYDVDRPHDIDPNIRITFTSTGDPDLSQLTGVPGACSYDASVEVVLATQTNEVTERLWSLRNERTPLRITIEMTTEDGAL